MGSEMCIRDRVIKDVDPRRFGLKLNQPPRHHPGALKPSARRRGREHHAKLIDSIARSDSSQKDASGVANRERERLQVSIIVPERYGRITAHVATHDTHEVNDIASALSDRGRIDLGLGTTLRYHLPPQAGRGQVIGQACWRYIGGTQLHRFKREHRPKPVSYTHLTLPTICSV